MELSLRLPVCARFLCLVAIAFTVGACSSAAETPPAARGSLPELDPLAPDASVVCGIIDNAAGVPEPELYMLAPMNRKLSHYPDFAATVPVPVVKDCASARQYMSALYRYMAEHPGFDLDEELGPIMSDDGSAPPALVSGSGESQKIFAGEWARNDAVVGIDFTMTSSGTKYWQGLRGKTGGCTATFISKNWLLTAAHCITDAAIEHCVANDVPFEECRPRWASWNHWIVRGRRGSQLDPALVSDEVMLRTYVHPAWYGRTLNDNPGFCSNKDPGGEDGVICDAIRAASARNDLALLYVPYQYDGLFVPSLENDGAKRLSVAPLQTNWDFVAYGWGSTVAFPDTDAISVLYRTKTPFKISLRDPEQVIVGKITNTTDSLLCGGDSGGPLMRRATIILDNGMSKDVETIVGVASYGYRACTAPTDASVPQWQWANVEQPSNRGFIEKVVLRWPFAGVLTCTSRHANGDLAPPAGPLASAIECWGKPCKIEKDCPSSDFECWRPGTEIARAGGFGCEVCGTSGDCSCIVGQCLDKRKK